MLELLTDIKILLKARKSRDMMIIFYEDKFRKDMQSNFHNIFLVGRIMREARRNIEREEQFYKRIKGEKWSKWKSRMTKKR